MNEVYSREEEEVQRTRRQPRYLTKLVPVDVYPPSTDRRTHPLSNTYHCNTFPNARTDTTQIEALAMQPRALSQPHLPYNTVTVVICLQLLYSLLPLLTHKSSTVQHKTSRALVLATLVSLEYMKPL